MSESKSGGQEAATHSEVSRLNAQAWIEEGLHAVEMDGMRGVGADLDEAVSDLITDIIGSIMDQAPDGFWAFIFDNEVELVVLGPRVLVDGVEVRTPVTYDLTLPRYANDEELAIIQAAGRPLIKADDAWSPDIMNDWM